MTRSVLCALVAVTGCIASPQLNPRAIDDQRGGVMGRVQVLGEGRDITRACTLGVRTEGGRVPVRPDEAGWVFLSLPRGEASIVHATCGIGFDRAISDLDFDVHGDGRTTYFGHVRIDLKRAFSPSLLTPHVVGAGMGTLAPFAGAAVSSTDAFYEDGERPDTPETSVDDKTYEATSAYHARYGVSPKALVVSLAGSIFSSDPSLSASAQRNGDVVYTQASLNGVTLTWLGVAGQAERKIALRLTRFVRQEEPCASMTLVLDGRESTIPVKTKRERASVAFKEHMQSQTDLASVRAIASAKSVLIKACGMSRTFSSMARGATINFVNAYQDMLRELPPAATSAPVSTAPAQAAEPVPAASP